MIDWTAPWLAPYAANALVVPDSGVAQALNSAAPSPVRFVSQSALPDGQAYEQFIFETQTVPVRDALTVFDENAAFLLAPQPLWDALIARDWQRLFVELRPMWLQAQVLLFGHALLEKLVYPRKPITAHVYIAQPAIKSIADLDAWMAGDITADKLASKPFTALPVLGVPGWWPDNENPCFYGDILVFRPEKQKISKITRTPVS